VKSRAALCLLGAWLMGSLMMFVVAPKNFHLIDELLAGSSNARFRDLSQQLGPGAARELLRYLASELNRVFFLLWNLAQSLLGGLVLACCWRAGDRRARQLALAALLLVLLLLGVLTPLITSVGRSLDFVPREPPPPQLARFQLLHVAYTALDLAKVACLALALVRLVRAAPAPA
jgi:hypothetical protein